MDNSKNPNHYPYASQAILLSCLGLYLVVLGLSVFGTWKQNHNKELIAINPRNTTATIYLVNKMSTSYRFWIGGREYEGSVGARFNDPDHICVTYYKNDPAINTGCDLTEDTFQDSKLIGLMGGIALLAGFIYIIITKKAHLTQ